jgi:hypothetical protein
MRALLLGVLAQRRGVRGPGLLRGQLRCARQRNHRAAILRGVCGQLLGAQLAGAPALIERVLEHVDRAARLVEP